MGACFGCLNAVEGGDAGSGEGGGSGGSSGERLSAVVVVDVAVWTWHLGLVAA